MGSFTHWKSDHIGGTLSLQIGLVELGNLPIIHD
jgi:hypothetical protein